MFFKLASNGHNCPGQLSYFYNIIIFRSDKENQRGLEFNDDLEEESETEENINYETDSDEERKSAKKFKKVVDDGDKDIYIER